MKRKKVSVIVPVYNVEKYLEKCLDSLVNQTLKDIEIIVVNDGSPDNSQVIIDKYAENYPKLVRSYIKPNGGLGDARNFGLKKAKGEYVAFVDSDDFVNNDMMEKLYNKADSEKSDLVVCGYNVLSENYEHICYSQSFDKNIGNNLRMNVLLGDNAAWNKLYKRDLLVNNNLTFRSKIWYEDIDFKVNVLLHCNNLSIVEEGLYNYLIRQGSIMNNSNIEKNLDILLAFDAIIDYCKRSKKFKKYYNEIEFLAIQHIIIACISRVIGSQGDKGVKESVIGKLFTYLNNHFPSYEKNKYIKKLKLGKKVVFYLIKYRLYGILEMLLKLKR